MWVKLLNNQNVVRKGVMTQYHKGDWVSVGKQVAQQWVDGGGAITIDPDDLAKGVAATSGVLVRGNLSDEWRRGFDAVTDLQIAIADDTQPLELPFTETLIWTTSLPLRLDLLLVGFEKLKTWQVVVPIYDYTTLALHVGSGAEREATKEVIRDLRVPVRDTRLVYVKRCATTTELMDVWKQTLKTCQNEQLAFLQAIYTVKPLVLDVPASWGGRQ